jgi:peptidoglycan/LPS O-acetylase OafA/YrhL
VQGITYRPEIDGLRALAILPVILFHLNPALLPNGYLGVDVFFVISGFLITSLILRGGQGESGFAFKEFYLRRIRRLFPAMAAVLAACLIYGLIFEDPATLRSYAAQVISVLLLAGNLKMRAQAGDYWGDQAEDVPLLHTWSLAVEEQFYVFFPVLLLGVMRLCPRRRWWLVGLGTATLSLGLQAYWRTRDPAAAFYLLPARAWELLVGCTLAVWAEPHREDIGQRFRWLAGAGLLLMLAGFLVALPGRQGAQGVLMLAVLGAFLVIAFTTGGGCATRKLLAARPLVFIGQISYSLYLWHWPVIVFCRLRADAPLQSLPAGAFFPAAVGLMAVLSLGSYYAVERPLRKWRHTPWLSLGIGLLLLGAALWFRLPPPVADTGSEFKSVEFAPMVIRGHRFTLNPAMVNSATFRAKYSKVKFEISEQAPSFETGVLRMGASTNLDMVMFGNSHAMVVASAVDRILASNRLSGAFFIADGVSPRLDREPKRDEPGLFAAELERYDRARLDVLARRPSVCVLAMRYDWDGFEDIRATLDQIVAHSHLVFVQQPPCLNIGDKCTVEAFDDYGRRLGSFAPLNIRERRQSARGRHAFEEKLRAHFAGNPRFHFLETEAEFLEPSGRIRWWDGQGTLWYLDDDHLSEEGVERFRPRLETLVVELCAAARREAKR